jgi:hypothetical protein
MSVTAVPQRTRRRSRNKRARQRAGGKIRILAALLLLLGLAGVIVFLIREGEGRVISDPRIARLAALEVPDWVDQQILPEGCDSRRGDLLEACNGVVIHYVGNPGTTAAQNRSYYGNPGTKVNSHFLIGLEGEIIQCLPLEEKSSATSERNRDTISIEVCHPDEEGKFTSESYAALVRLTAWLMDACELEGEEALLRHYDATGKACPIYYVKNEEAWLQLKADVVAARQNP